MNKLIIQTRCFLHDLILLLPQKVRTFLAKSKLLEKAFLYLDDARYLRASPDRESSEPHKIAHKPLTYYTFDAPALTETVIFELASFGEQPLISIILPVFDVNPQWLKLALASIENQWYKNWEICIVDDHSSNPETLNYLKSVENSKIKVRYNSSNMGISVASNDALAFASGDYVALIDHDDEYTPDALFEVVKTINHDGAEFIYSDEDKLAMDGTFREPHFKPEFSPDMLLSQNYLNHLCVIKKSLIEQVGGFSAGLEGAQDYDLYLKVLEHTNKVAHISRVLYHWRKIPGSTATDFDDKSYARDAGKRALDFALKRRQLDAQVHNGKYPGTYRVQYAIKNEPLVSIIIPFKDKPELLQMCIESILEKSTYQNFEILGISNNSEEEETFSEITRLEALDSRISFFEHNVPFNFSEINNFAINTHANGEHILLLNNDIEIISPGWIESLLEYSQREDIGAVGGKLYYPDGRIQHAGVIIGIGGVAGHSHKYIDGDHHGFFSRPHIVQNLSAVTGACLMVKRDVFDEVNGLDSQNLSVAFNDIDFCLRIREKGYLNVFTPYCEAYHHESVSRGHEITQEQKIRFNEEVKYMAHRHSDILENGDPYYNHRLSLHHEDFSLS
jgi:GT2 family glycosyltransferase